jgi:methanogenic corrinoid protein MtbC1
MADPSQAYLETLLRGDREAALEVARAALAQAGNLGAVYLQILQPAMYEVGRLWEANQVTVAQEHTATAITQSVMAQLASSVFAGAPLGRHMVAVCIGSERHEVGIRMVADVFRQGGWEVAYLGLNVPQAEVLRTLAERRADLLAVSVTLGSHLPQARELIAAVRATPALARCRIAVGGQPLNCTPELYLDLGADFTARDAREALERANAAL